MKKSVFTLLALLACTIYPARAYEYFTIYFSDGTKSEAFYATDVDSICYSKLSLDSIAYDDWQVQEIYTCDSVYRYPLAQIDSLSFKDVDENEVAVNISRISKIIVPLYVQCGSTEEISQHLTTIYDIESVEDAWVDNKSLFVKIKDCGTMLFYYPIERKKSKDVEQQSAARMLQKDGDKMSSSHLHSDAHSICIVNQLAHADQFYWDTIDKDSLIVECRRWGMESVLNTHPSLGFFEKDIYNYDLVFIDTHGIYNNKDKKHWLLTGEKITQTIEVDSKESLDEIPSLLNNSDEMWAKALFELKYFSPKNTSIAWVPEKHNEKWQWVCYITISENYILSSPNQFDNKGTTIIFNAACESLKGNDNLAYAFMAKGAGCYLGYTETNTVGGQAGFNFFRHLLNGKCTSSALQSLPDRLRDERWYKYVWWDDNEQEIKVKETDIDDPNFNEGVVTSYRSVLQAVPKNSSICISYPQTSSIENTENSDIVKMKAQMKINNIAGYITGYEYGFQWSKNSDMSQPDSAKVEGNYDPTTLYMSWEKTLDENDLEPNTTYFYRAYMNDGYSDCYGEIKSFTTPDKNAEPYGVLSEKGTLLTYYYDGKKNEREGQIVSVPYNYSIIEMVSFDASFANYYPTSTKNWFSYMDNLTSIQHIEYVNTANVTDMSYMFYRCGSLASLDVSNFNTVNVTNMWALFDGCSSLMSLDVSNFNTANVTSMADMFGGCSSLTSLDVSNFNTANVTSMAGMFSDCSSLTSLDVSNFNTDNVTKMWDMFSGCSSLTSLDVSNFNTSNVTLMPNMFFGCSSLSSLDVSNFNTANVTSMASMFSGCSSLTSLDVSKFNTSNVTTMKHMFYGCSSLTSLDLSKFNTSNVTDMSGMFNSCRSLTSLDLSKFNTTNVVNMHYMFSDCHSLIDINVNSFNISSIGANNIAGNDICGMFCNCLSLMSLDLSSFYFTRRSPIDDMFYNCSSLTTIYASCDWNVFQYASTGCFHGCNKLVGGKGTRIGMLDWTGFLVGDGASYARIDGGVAYSDGGSHAGFFTAK